MGRPAETGLFGFVPSSCSFKLSAHFRFDPGGNLSRQRLPIIIVVNTNHGPRDRRPRRLCLDREFLPVYVYGSPATLCSSRQHLRPAKPYACCNCPLGSRQWPGRRGDQRRHAHSCSHRPRPWYRRLVCFVGYYYLRSHPSPVSWPLLERCSLDCGHWDHRGPYHWRGLCPGELALGVCISSFFLWPLMC